MTITMQDESASKRFYISRQIAKFLLEIKAVKFNVDKRKAHFASLVASKTISRDEALESLKKPTYDPDLQKQDYEYALKKFEVTREEFEGFMSKPPIEHSFYGTQWDKEHFRKYYIFKKLATPILNLIAKLKNNES